MAQLMAAGGVGVLLGHVVEVEVASMNAILRVAIAAVFLAASLVAALRVRWGAVRGREMLRGRVLAPGETFVRLASAEFRFVRHRTFMLCACLGSAPALVPDPVAVVWVTVLLAVVSLKTRNELKSGIRPEVGG
jgi:hypothetical protein